MVGLAYPHTPALTTERTVIKKEPEQVPESSLSPIPVNPVGSSGGGNKVYKLLTYDASSYFTTTKSLMQKLSNAEGTKVEVLHKGPVESIIKEVFMDAPPLPSPSNLAKICNSLVPSEALLSIMGPETDFERTSTASQAILEVENMDDKEKQLVEQVTKAGQSDNFQDVVSKLTNVEGYESESWGSAVNVENPAFYPKNLTSGGLRDDEFKEFMESDSDDDATNGKLENGVCNDTQAQSQNQVQLATGEILTSLTAVVVEEGSHAMEIQEASENGLKIVDLVVEGEVAEVDPYNTPCDPRRPPEARGDYKRYLDKDIGEIPSHAITSTFVLDYFLEGAGSNLGEQQMDVHSTGPKEDSDIVATSSKLAANQATPEVAVEGTKAPNKEGESRLEGSQQVVIDGTCPPMDFGSETELFVADNIVENLSDQEPGDETEPKTQAMEKPSVSSGATNEESGVPKEMKDDKPKVAPEPESFSLPDPQRSRRSRSKSYDGNSSQVSVASTSSSNSSVRPCSVVLERLSPSRSPGPSRSIRVSESSNNSSVAVVDSPNVATNKKEDADDDGRVQPPTGSKTPTKSNGSNTTENVPIVDGSTSKADKTEDEPVPLLEKVPIKAKPKSRKIKVHVKTEPAADDSSNMDDTVINQTTSNDKKTIGRKRVSTTDANHAVVKKERSDEESPKPPEIPVSEMTRKAVLKFIKEESLKAEPDFGRLSEAMTMTYATERKPLYDNNQVELKDVVKCFALNHFKMVKEEYGRILGDVTKMEQLEKELSTGGVLTAALEPKETKKKISIPKQEKKHSLWKQAIKLWNEKKPSPDYQKVLGILAVCFKFAENDDFNKLCHIVKKGKTINAKTMKTPTIVVNEEDLFNAEGESEIWIYVDCSKYLQVPNMYEAVLSTFAVYYLLNINYAKELKFLFEFFDMLNGNNQSTYSKTKQNFSRSHK